MQDFAGNMLVLFHIATKRWRSEGLGACVADREAARGGNVLVLRRRHVRRKHGGGFAYGWLDGVRGAGDQAEAGDAGARDPQ